MDIMSGSSGNYRKLMLAGQLWEQDDLEALKEYVDVCAKVQKPRIILDLERLSFINSRALGLIVKLHLVCQDAGGKLILFQPKLNVKEVIEITGLSTFLSIAYNTNELTQAME